MKAQGWIREIIVVSLATSLVSVGVGRVVTAQVQGEPKPLQLRSWALLVPAAEAADADELIREAKRLKELAEKARQGGPNFWRQRAARHRVGAGRALESGQGRKAESEQQNAKEAEETAKELEKRGVPDKPDPNLPPAQRQQIDKQREDAIKRIEEERKQLIEKAKQVLKGK